MRSKIDSSFFRRDDVVQLSRELLGKALCTRLDGVETSVLISETEAYAGIEDRASHAYGGRRTKRTEPMYAQGGTAYVYLCYGIHHLFNIVTNVADVPHAILIRAGVPLAGVDVMARRRGRDAADPVLLSGPGSLAQALGITTGLTGVSLTGERIWLEDRGLGAAEDELEIGPRVGIDYAGPDAARPYRFRVPAAALAARASGH